MTDGMMWYVVGQQVGAQNKGDPYGALLAFGIGVVVFILWRVLRKLVRHMRLASLERWRRKRARHG